MDMKLTLLVLEIQITVWNETVEILETPMSSVSGHIPLGHFFLF